MTNFKKVIKNVWVAFGFFLIVVGVIGIIVGVVLLISGGDAVLEESKTYSVSQNVRELDVEIGAADFTIVKGETLSVESNLRYLTVKEKNGCLQIEEKRNRSKDYEGATLILYLPEDFVFEEAEIATGAGVLKIDAFSAKKLTMELGAGEVEISKLTATEHAEIEGGAGKLTIKDGSLSNLDFEMGLGELNLTAAILGNSEIDCGVGKMNLTLKGGRETYSVILSKGIGNATVDGQNVKNGETVGGGANKLQINGGIGEISVEFQ